ncbi:MAG: sulfite exporter TauE/SafE family protein [Rhodospirillales bacterium]
MPVFDTMTVTVALVGFAFGGVVKGVTGIGLPIVAISVLSSFLPAPLVLGLVTVPIVLTNLWLAVQSGNLMAPLRRFWPMIACFLGFIWVGARIVVNLDADTLFGLLGAVVVLFTATNYVRPVMRVPPPAEIWAGPLAGALGGLLGGVSTIWGPPMTMYFIMLRLSKDMFVRTIGLVWFAGSIPLVLAYVDNGILTAEVAPLSLLACVPGVAGMWVGQKIRDRINQETFRKALLVTLFVIGLNLIRRAVF